MAAKVTPLQATENERDCEAGIGDSDDDTAPCARGKAARLRMGVSMTMSASRHKLKMQKIDASFATNVLANERTLLAWMRTCLAVISLGAVLSRIIEKDIAASIGAAFVVGSGFMAVLGAYLYVKRNDDLVEDRRIRISNSVFGLVSVFIFAISLCVVVLLFW